MRFHGICLIDEDSEDTVTLVVRADSEADARELLHKEHSIAKVVEVLTDREARERRIKLKGR